MPVLYVEEAARAVAWYERLGFQKEWEHQFEPGFPWFVSVARGDRVRLYLSEHKGDARPNTLIHLYVADIDRVSDEFGIPVDEEGLAGARVRPRGPGRQPAPRGDAPRLTLASSRPRLPGRTRARDGPAGRRHEPGHRRPRWLQRRYVRARAHPPDRDGVRPRRPDLRHPGRGHAGRDPARDAQAGRARARPAHAARARVARARAVRLGAGPARAPDLAQRPARRPARDRQGPALRRAPAGQRRRPRRRASTGAAARPATPARSAMRAARRCSRCGRTAPTCASWRAACATRTASRSSRAPDASTPRSTAQDELGTKADPEPAEMAVVIRPGAVLRLAALLAERAHAAAERQLRRRHPAGRLPRAALLRATGSPSGAATCSWPSGAST